VKLTPGKIESGRKFVIASKGTEDLKKKKPGQIVLCRVSIDGRFSGIAELSKDRCPWCCNAEGRCMGQEKFRFLVRKAGDVRVA